MVWPRVRELVVARTGVSISSRHPPHLTKPTTSWHGASGGITRAARPPHCNGIGCRRDGCVLSGPSRTLDKDQRTPTDTRVATNSCDAACDGWLCCLRFLACVPFDVTVWMCGSLKKHSETEMPHPPKCSRAQWRFEMMMQYRCWADTLCGTMPCPCVVLFLH